VCRDESGHFTEQDDVGRFANPGSPQVCEACCPVRARRPRRSQIRPAAGPGSSRSRSR
jgi:hypothetical protein